MGRKGIDRGHKEEWQKNHIKILKYLRDEGLLERRGKSEMARALGIARSTLNDHLAIIPRDKFFLKMVGKEKRLFLQRDYSEALAEALINAEEPLFKTRKASYIYLNVPQGKEIGSFSVISDVDENRQKLISIFSPLQQLFFDIDPFLLRHIFRYALRQKLITEAYFNGKKDITKISDEELERLWHNLFGDSKKAIITFSINPQKLLEWIKGQGRDDLKRVLSKEVCRELYREASELWKQREEMERFLEKHKEALEKHP